jgi:Na+-transporting NADH:ubiquinone oxidoreductase subunit NqrB
MNAEVVTVWITTFSVSVFHVTKETTSQQCPQASEVQLEEQLTMVVTTSSQLNLHQHSAQIFTTTLLLHVAKIT